MTVPAMSTLTSVSTASTRKSISSIGHRQSDPNLTLRSDSSLGPFFARLDDHASLSSMTSTPITATDYPPPDVSLSSQPSTIATDPKSTPHVSTFSSSSPSHPGDTDDQSLNSQQSSHFLLTSSVHNLPQHPESLPRTYKPFKRAPRPTPACSTVRLAPVAPPSPAFSNDSSLPNLALDLSPTIAHSSSYFSPPASPQSSAAPPPPLAPNATVSTTTSTNHPANSNPSFLASPVTVSSTNIASPCSELSLLGRSTSDHQQQQQQHHHSSFSLLARRHFGKLSNAVVSPQPRDMDCDSVISEPASYSNATFVASDLWLVQRDVQPAEQEIAERDRRRQLRASLRTSVAVDSRRTRTSLASALSSSRRGNRASSADRSFVESISSLRKNYVEIRGEYERATKPTADNQPYHQPHVEDDDDGVIKTVQSLSSMSPGVHEQDVSTNHRSHVFDHDADSHVGADEDDDEEEGSPSSLLVSQFFSGAVAGFGSRRLDDRDRGEFRADGTTFQRKYPERCTGRQTRRFGLSSGRHDLSQPLRQTTHAGQFVEDASYDGSKRRVSRGRRIRWWLRRVSHRFRMEAEHA